jgi:hypothetical protein
VLPQWPGCERGNHIAFQGYKLAGQPNFIISASASRMLTAWVPAAAIARELAVPLPFVSKLPSSTRRRDADILQAGCLSAVGLPTASKLHSDA